MAASGGRGRRAAATTGRPRRAAGAPLVPLAAGLVRSLCPLTSAVFGGRMRCANRSRTSEGRVRSNTLARARSGRVAAADTADRTTWPRPSTCRVTAEPTTAPVTTSAASRATAAEKGEARLRATLVRLATGARGWHGSVARVGGTPGDPAPPGSPAILAGRLRRPRSTTVPDILPQESKEANGRAEIEGAPTRRHPRRSFRERPRANFFSLDRAPPDPRP